MGGGKKTRISNRKRNSVSVKRTWKQRSEPDSRMESRPGGKGEGIEFREKRFGQASRFWSGRGY